VTEKIITAFVTILTGIIGVAVLAMLVSPKADTVNVIGASASGFGCALKTAITGVNACGGGGLIPSVNSTITFGSGLSGQ
jgi:hypothetical protein